MATFLELEGKPSYLALTGPLPSCIIGLVETKPEPCKCLLLDAAAENPKEKF